MEMEMYVPLPAAVAALSGSSQACLLMVGIVIPATAQHRTEQQQNGIKPRPAQRKQRQQQSTPKEHTTENKRRITAKGVSLQIMQC
jgi:hypothetical protein